MKIIALNGSPKSNGNTAQLLKHFGSCLPGDIEFEVLNVGNIAKSGCTGCGNCRKTGSLKCITDDGLNEFLPKIIEADGIVIASPVYYAGISGGFKSFLDRAFYAISGELRHKVGAVFSVARRGGTVSTFDQLNHYFSISNMIIVGSCYWNIAHGAVPGEVQEDAEGLNAAKTAAQNMGWLVKVLAENKIEAPEKPQNIRTNFVR